MRRTFLITLALGAATTALAAQAPISPPTGQQTLAVTMGVYVFPAAGQETALQNRQESECYAWAVKNTGSDPFDLARGAERQQQQAAQAKSEVARAGQGAEAKGMLAGAATGALIGEIASNDAGEGAAYGAALGLIAARRQKRRAQQQATEQIDQQVGRAQQATAGQIEGFKKAFAVCLEAKEYLVRF